jgi:peroxiredoxin
VAISVDPSDKRQALASRLSVSFPILSDTDLAITKAFGAVENGKAHPAPMSIVLDENRKVLYAKKGKNAGDRPTTDQLLEVL